MIRILLAILAAVSSAAAAADKGRSADQAAPSQWRQEPERLHLDQAGVSAPVTVAGLRQEEIREFSRPGEGLDTALIYRSPDGELLATIYVYLPGLAHTGLAAFATDVAIHATSRNELRRLGTRLSAAGGVPDAAIRSDYRGYLNGNASSAAFVKAGRWMVKLRVSGPEQREQDVFAAMDALLASLTFAPGRTPHSAAPLDFAQCSMERTGPAARLDNYDEMFAAALAAAIDGASIRSVDEAGRELRPHPGRVGGLWCAPSVLHVGGRQARILRSAEPSTAPSPLGRSLMIAVISDSGKALEVVELPPRPAYALFYHEIGTTALIGVLDAPPSEEQIAELLAEGFSPWATVHVSPNGDTRIQVPPPPEDAADAAAD